MKHALALAALLSLAAAPPPKATQAPNTPLAIVNGEPITVHALISAFSERHAGHAKFLGGYGEARSFLGIMVEERLFIQEAYNVGLDRDETVQRLVSERENEKISAKLVHDEIDEKSKVSPDEVKAVWKDSLSFFLQVRQIAVETKSEAEEIRAALLSGADFDELARTCSKVASSKNGGHLMVNWGQFGPEWERVVFALQPGELSPVIETTDGYELVLVEGRLDVPPPPFDKVSAQIESALTVRKSEARKRAFSDELFAKYHVQLAPVDKAAPDSIIATWDGGGKLKFRDAVSAADLQLWKQFTPKRAQYELESRIRATINEPLAILEARARKFNEDPDIADMIAKYRETMMENALFRGHVLKDVTVSDDEIAKYYDAHKTEFVEPEQRHVAHILVPTEKEANAIYEQLKSGADFSQLARKYSKDAETALYDGKLGWITEEKVPPSFRQVLTLEPGTISKPIKSDHGWHIVQVSDVKPKRQLALDEVKDRAKEKARAAKEQSVQNFWLEKLRAAAKVTIDEKAIRTFVAENQFDGNAAPPKHDAK
ncbi:MAG TPA: peptidylprolyl isomerase [Thermoanaerobaculia bacterium]|jgi:peptidyl-prolyl cis-trans isomerase C|nr:peptidylprolyl isomerase [Thermoanaerobaculia bacterium]